MVLDCLAYLAGLCAIESFPSPSDHFREVLMRRPVAGFPEAAESATLKHHFQTVNDRLAHDPDLQKLFHLRLAARLLTAREPVGRDIRAFLRDRMDFQDLLGFGPEPFQDGCWCAVPVLLTVDGRTLVRWFILGERPGPERDFLMPSWALPLFDPIALSAIQSAARAAENLSRVRRQDRQAGLFCFPLTLPVSCDGQRLSGRIQGASLGLPLALGFAAVLSGRTPPPDIAATGGITDQGEITAVGNLDRKIKGIQAGFQALIFPRANGPAPSSSMTCLPVSTLGQAHMLFSFYSPSIRERLPLLSACFEDPRLLAENIGLLPTEWIEWSWQNQTLDILMERIIDDPPLFAAFTSAFEQKTTSFELKHAAAIQKLVPEAALERLSDRSILTVFRWYTASLALANHGGRIRQARKWEEKGLALTKQAFRADIAVAVDFYNHALVARHNRFCFSRDLPDDLNRLLVLLETLYSRKCEFGCRADLMLGRLYGTLMQHFAFCGPSCLDRTVSYSRKARIALGEDCVPEYREEWRRQYNYLTYALLDAGRIEEADISLARYLGLSNPDRLTDHVVQNAASRFSEWEIALVARFLAERPGHPGAESMLHALAQRFESTWDSPHPWQLIAFNLGRIALDLGETDSAGNLMNQCLALCMAPSAGPTIRVMALLPLSRMPDRSRPDSELLKAWDNDIRKAASTLDLDHFQFLAKNTLEAACETVRNTPGRIFPFNYR